MGCLSYVEVVHCWLTTAFTGLRPVDARITENPPAATPVQRFVIHVFRSNAQATSSHESLRTSVTDASRSQKARGMGIALLAGNEDVD